MRHLKGEKGHLSKKRIVVLIWLLDSIVFMLSILLCAPKKAETQKKLLR